MAAAGADYEDSPVHICAWVLHGVGKEGDGWRYEGCIYLFAIFFWFGLGERFWVYWRLHALGGEGVRGGWLGAGLCVCDAPRRTYGG